MRLQSDGRFGGQHLGAGQQDGAGAGAQQGAGAGAAQHFGAGLQHLGFAAQRARSLESSPQLGRLAAQHCASEKSAEPTVNDEKAIANDRIAIHPKFRLMVSSKLKTGC